jgi:hypothetical protein
MQYKIKHSILGGTFDHLHCGHKYFLDKAFELSEIITIGITSQNFFKDKILDTSIEDFSTREKTLKDYLDEKGYLKRASVIVLNDIFGNSLTKKNIDAIFVSEAGIKNAELINKKREEINFPPLKIIKVGFFKDDEGNIISSTDIRMGIADRNGYFYKSFFNNTKELVVPLSLREELRNPFGEIIKNTADLAALKQKSFIISIGDVVTAILLRQGIKPEICVFDLKTKRENIVDKEILDILPQPDALLENKPGTINSSTAIYLKNAILKCLTSDTQIAIQINGEEDLLTLPAILFAPLNSIVLYGIRDIGTIFVTVTEENKNIILTRFLNKFEIIR